MIALLLALALDNPLSEAPVCHLQAGVIRSSLSHPRAEIYVQYLDGNCGEKPPIFESETATVWNVTEDVAEEDDPAKDCHRACIEESDDPDCDEDECPARTFQATVTGPVGKHVIEVYAENEGAAKVCVTLRGWQ